MVDAPIRLSGNQQFHFGTLMPFRVGASIPLLSGNELRNARPFAVNRLVLITMGLDNKLHRV
jgi:hypothetical protein